MAAESLRPELHTRGTDGAKARSKAVLLTDSGVNASIRFPLSSRAHRGTLSSLAVLQTPAEFVTTNGRTTPSSRAKRDQQYGTPPRHHRGASTTARHTPHFRSA